MLRVTVILILYFLSVYASCNKDKNCAIQTYSFATGIRSYPDTDSININDTIWLEFISPTRLTDLSTGNIISYSAAKNLGTDINFFQFTGGSISNPGAIPAVDAFEYKLIYGEFIPDNVLPEQNKDYKFAEINNEYRFKLGIIPKRVGIFSFSPGDAGGVVRNNDECSKANFKITFTNTNQHMYFYEQNRLGYVPSQYEQTHMYCFKVK
jgi:hypothetical protein